MMVRAAVAVGEKSQADMLTNRLVSFAIKGCGGQTGIDMDIAYYQGDLKELLAAFTRFDIALISYDLLEENRANLEQCRR